MGIRLDKKTIVIIAVIGLGILLGIGGYIAWRVSQPKDILPGESRAGNDTGICGCIPLSCPVGTHTCDEHYNPGCGTEQVNNTECCCTDSPDGVAGTCADCRGRCDRHGCIHGCPSDVNPRDQCGIWPMCYYCRGRSHSACAEGHDGYYYANSKVLYEEEYWCSTIQCDSNSPNGACIVLYIGDRGEWCIDGNDICHTDLQCSSGVTDSNGDGRIDEDDLDWDCNPDRFLQIQGRVYCQDPGGEIYPIEGATVTFYKDGARSLSEDLVTSGDGSFLSVAGTTQHSHGGFAVRLERIPSGTLPTDVNYSDMEGPYLENPGICTAGICSSCSPVEPQVDGTYEQCGSLAEEGVNPGFNWVYRACSQEPPNPDWDIEKTGSVVCYEEGTVNVYAELTYIITITNTQDGGNLEYVRDEYDEQIQQSWIISTQPTASQITSEYIQWDIPEDEQTFEEGESREFRYTARIPRELFGEELENHAIGHLGTDEELHAYEDIFVTCGLPGVGIFDSTASRIALGGVLLMLGFVYYRFGVIDGFVMWSVRGLSRVSGWIKYETGVGGMKKRWEQRMLKKVNRRRKT